MLSAATVCVCVCVCVCVDILVSVQHEDSQAHNNVAGSLNFNGTVYVCINLIITFYIRKVQPTRCNVSQIISVRRSTHFRRFFCPLPGAQNCTYSVRYCQTVTATCR